MICCCCCCCCSTFVTCWQRARRGWQEWSCDCDKSACAVVQLGHKVPVEGTSVPRGPRSWILGRLRCGFGGFVGLVCCRENSRRSKQLDGNSGTVESRDREECLSGASRKMGMFAARGHGVLKKGRGRVGSLVQVLGGEALPVCQQPAEEGCDETRDQKSGPSRRHLRVAFPFSGERHCNTEPSAYFPSRPPTAHQPVGPSETTSAAFQFWFVVVFRTSIFIFYRGCYSLSTTEQRLPAQRPASARPSLTLCSGFCGDGRQLASSAK